uniref:GYF domain-containing protein n=1 Tax=Rhizochromulina marina TaxID=1034831 RepID=A0A7S2WIT0_9STRA
MSAAWLWTEEGAQKGPLPETALFRLMQRSPVLRQQLAAVSVWRQGMAQWQRAVDTPPFRDHIIALLSHWYCSADGGQRLGPFTFEQVATKVQGGEIDGMTLLWGQSEYHSSTTWHPLSGLAALKAAIQGAEDGADGDEGAGSSEQVFDPSQVFQGHEQPPLPKESTEAASSSAAAGEAQKRYVADDGTRFVWSEETGDWVEYDGKEEWLDEEEEEPSSSRPGHAKKGDPASSTEAGKAADGGQQAGEKGPQKKRKKKSRKHRGLAWNDKAAKTWIYVTGMPADVEVPGAPMLPAPCFSGSPTLLATRRTNSRSTSPSVASSRWTLPPSSQR